MYSPFDEMSSCLPSVFSGGIALLAPVSMSMRSSPAGYLLAVRTARICLSAPHSLKSFISCVALRLYTSANEDTPLLHH